MAYSIGLGKIKKISRSKKYQQGAVISSDGSDAEFYVVLKGEIGIFINYQKPNEEMIATVSPGDFYVETAPIMKKNRHETVVAISDVFAVHIDKSNMADFFSEEPEFAYDLFKAMGVRLEMIAADFEKQCGHAWSKPKAASPEAIHARNVVLGADFSLFPEGHGQYELSLDNANKELLSDSSVICPNCKRRVAIRKVRNTNLTIIKTDRDMRNHYKGIEPLHYDVVTCPDCLYSALGDMFESPDQIDAVLPRELQNMKHKIKLLTGLEMDNESVFAGYYLALHCAPKSFRRHQLVTARLLLKLSRIYEDCGDSAMADQTAQKSLDAYLYAYMHLDVSDKEDQQLCIIIGELSLRLNDLKTAKNYFYKAKTEKTGSPSLKRQAENRLMDIREMESK